MRIFVFIIFIFLFGCNNSDEEYDPTQNPDRDNRNNLNIYIDSDSPPKSILNFEKDSISYLALGDSYTIGTGEKTENSWPNLLQTALYKNGYLIHSPRIVANVGWTTRNLLKVIESQEFKQKYELVSLLIGVNNQYRNISFETFEKEFVELLSFSLNIAKSKSGVFVLSIPDYGATPFGQSNEARISEEINEYNAYIEKVCKANKIKFYDITEVSRNAKDNSDLLAMDQLHPSRKMYEEWIKLILNNPPEIFLQ